MSARVLDTSYLRVEPVAGSAPQRAPASGGGTVAGADGRSVLARSRGLEILYRAPARFLAARNEPELLDVLSSLLSSLHRNLCRFDVYGVDDEGRLLPLAGVAGPPRRGGLALLATLEERVREAGAQGSTGPRRLPGGMGTQGGALMSAPLRAPRTIIGLIVVEAHPGAAAFTSSELEMFDGVAALFSLALQRLRTSERERVRASVELDRKSARAVQRRLLGDGLPARCGVIADTRYLPALDVGGDFYQLTDLGDDGVGAAIGDVSGKGVSAALIMSRVSSEVRRALRSGAWPSRVLQEVHATLADVDAETFVTASCLRIDARRRSLRVANAGHIPAVVRRATGEVSIVGSPSGTPLGMLACEYAEEEVRLEPRDIVLLMTDGLVEALDRPGDGDGEGALLGIIRSAPHDPTLLNERILQAVEVTRGIEAPDDMTLVALQLAM